MKFWSLEFMALFSVSLAALLILLPFFNSVLIGAITAYALHPLVYGIKKAVPSYTVAVILTVLIVAVPVFALLSIAVHDASPLISQISGLGGEITGVLESLRPELAVFGLSESLTNTQEIVDSIGDFVKEQLLISMQNIVWILINIVVFLFTTYYFLKDGNALKRLVVEYIKTLPFRDKKVGLSIVAGLENSFAILFFAYISMSVLDALLAWIGFELLGIPYSWILAILVGIAAFLPVIGMSWVYVPVAAYEYYIGNEITAMAVLLFGVFVLNIIPEMFLRPYVGAKIGKVHPITIVLGFFGGPIVFGIMGFVLGPIILVVAETVIRSYLELNIRIAKMDEKTPPEKKTTTS